MSGSSKKKRDDDGDFFLTQKWMRKLHYLDDKGEEKDLNGNLLSVYAIIYGYSKNGKGVYRGGYKYLAEWIGVTPGTAQVLVKKLVNSGLLQEMKSTKGNVIFNTYVALRPSENHTPTKIVPLRKPDNDPSENHISTPTKIVPNNITGKYNGISIYQREAPKRDGWMESNPDRETVEETFREQLQLDDLAGRYDPAALEELLAIIVGMYCCQDKIQYIGKTPQTTASICKLLDKLTGRHVEYIMDNLAQTTTPIKNILAYLQTTILRAATTLEFYEMTKTSGLCAQQSQREALPSIDIGAAAMSRRLRKGGGST